MKIRKVIATVFVGLGCCVAPKNTPAQTPDSWQVPIHIQIETFAYDLYFGVRPNATDAFNAGIDTVAPPPAFTPYAAFVIPTLPGTLRADFRGPGNMITWSLQLFNATGLPVEISWEAQQLPLPAMLSLNDSLDMLAQDSTVILNANVVVIRYQPLSTSVASPTAAVSPARYALRSFPNPFSNATAFEIRSPDSAPMVLRIFNVLGQEIRTFAILSSQQRPLVLPWDGNDARGRPVPDGLYFCRFESAQTVVIEKLIKMRHQ